MEHIAWMAWTLPTAIFFVMLALTLGVMTWLAIAYPEAERVGILRIPTTRGDRLFIGLLSAAYVNLIFVGISGKLAQLFSLQGDPSIWISFVVSMALLALIMRKG